MKIIVSFFAEYRGLSIIEKFGLWGSIASIGAVVLYLLPNTGTSENHVITQSRDQTTIVVESTTQETSGTTTPTINVVQENVTIQHGNEDDQNATRPSDLKAPNTVTLQDHLTTEQIRNIIDDALSSNNAKKAVETLAKLQDRESRDEECPRIFYYSLRQSLFTVAESVATLCWDNAELNYAMQEIYLEQQKTY